MTESSYQTLSSAALKSLENPVVDLYVQYDPQQPPTLFCRAGAQVEAEVWRRHCDNEAHEILILNRDAIALGTELYRSIGKLVDDESLPLAQRFHLSQLAITSNLHRIVQTNDIARQVEFADEASRIIISLVNGHQFIPSELYRLSRHDSSTFSHVVNVGMYAAVLGRHYGLSNESGLERFVSGALLHDIGKYHVPAAILQKPAELNHTERDIIKLHPTFGYRKLCRRPEVTYEQLMMVYQHHEHLDGGGYPVGAVEDEIHLWARLLAVIDVFDALTGNRPYRRPYGFEDAIQFLRRRSGKQFDVDAVNCWVSATS